MKHPLPIPFTQLRLTRLLNRPTPQRWWDGIPRSFTLNPTPITGIVPPMTPDDTTGDREDLAHKAVGWLLREAGRTDRARLERYLLAHGPAIPRTSLRYAIEHFPPRERRRLLEATRG